MIDIAVEKDLIVSTEFVNETYTRAVVSFSSSTVKNIVNISIKCHEKIEIVSLCCETKNELNQTLSCES